jgi:hypothetical protein
MLNGAPKTDRKYRILLIAEAANSEWAGVAQIGWTLSRAVAEIADIQLVSSLRPIGARGLVGRSWLGADSRKAGSRGRQTLTTTKNAGPAIALFELFGLPYQRAP